MNNKEFNRALHEGRRVYGTMIVSPSPEWPVAVRQVGLDFVFIDTEHIALDRSQVSWMCRTYSALDLVPIVRIPSPDPYEASMMLDCGAGGVLAPYIESAEEVRRLSGAVKFKPLKGKRLHRILNGTERIETELSEFLEAGNMNNTLLVNIESAPAIEALDEILAVPGLDAVLIGPHDLSINLGVPLQYGHPRFVEAVDSVIRIARARGKGVGVHAVGPDALREEIHWAGLGANILLHAADVFVFRRALQQDIRKLRETLGDRMGEETDSTERQCP
jgi:2-keto-3-deoxy-L-rhamnonate aldolase RhmA